MINLTFLEEDLANKERQINEVLDLIDILDRNNVFLSEENNLVYPSKRLINTLKGSTYLMLYNAVESTLRECINHIHDILETKNENFDNLRVEIKKEIFRRIKSGHREIKDIISESAKPISKTLHHTTLNKRKLFSGNIDAEEVKKLAIIYGFSISTDARKTKNGATLSDIKEKRNALAHGNIDFDQVARIESIRDIRDVASTTINYLSALLENIDDYITSNGFIQ